jgi:molecular chaperone Hsp33
LGLKEPYTGQVPIVSGEIAEDIASYFALSEQIPTVCGLGVLVNPDLTVKAAGGYLIQLLPFADEKCIDILEDNINKLPSVTEMLTSGLSEKDIAIKVLEGLAPEVLDETEAAYKCDCSKKRVERALISLGREELTAMAEEEEKIEVCCHFCNKSTHLQKKRYLN